MSEIEFNALSRACLKGRSPNADAPQCQTTAYETHRNGTSIGINRHLSTDDARTTLRRFYPCLSNAERVPGILLTGPVGKFSCVNVILNPERN